MNKFTSNIEGVCPKCGSYRLDHWDYEMDCGLLMYHWVCECGCRGIEYYQLTFDGHSVYNEETGDLDDVGVYLSPGCQLEEELK